MEALFAHFTLESLTPSLTSSRGQLLSQEPPISQREPGDPKRSHALSPALGCLWRGILCSLSPPIGRGGNEATRTHSCPCSGSAGAAPELLQLRAGGSVTRGGVQSQPRTLTRRHPLQPWRPHLSSSQTGHGVAAAVALTGTGEQSIVPALAVRPRAVWSWWTRAPLLGAAGPQRGRGVACGSPRGHREGNSWGGSEGWWERWRPGEPPSRKLCWVRRPDLLGPPRGRGRGGDRAPGRPLRTPPRPALQNPPGDLAAPSSGPAGRLAAALRCPRRCQELSSRPWRAQAPWTPRAAIRSCARCATRSTNALACSTASTTSAPAACAAAPATAA